MTAQNKRDLAASVHERLLQIAKRNGEEFQQILVRFGLERFLYRLSVSPEGKNFILKGALLFHVWGYRGHRPTKDLDLLGLGDPSPDRLKEVFKGICRLLVDEDGLVFDEGSVTADPIRVDQEYGGIRVLILATLGKARIRIQVDVGFGDAVVPKPEECVYPTLLPFPEPRLRAYHPATVVAEKFHAMVTLGMANSRMKDYFDILALSRTHSFQGEELVQAVSATFKSRNTDLPKGIPTGLSVEFGLDAQKKIQWNAFIRKIGEARDSGSMEDTVKSLWRFLGPPAAALQESKPFPSYWEPGGPWKESEKPKIR